MARFALIDGRPVPKKLEAEILALKAAVPGSNLNSCLRTQRAVSWARSKGATLSSQRELYDGYRSGRPGFNPANPPGRSTHERRNDGVAFGGPAGMPLQYYKVGLDWSLPTEIAAAARRRGWICTVTYPGVSREAQHLNFRKEPRLKVVKPLKRFSKGRRVKKLARQLNFLRDEQGNRYLAYRHTKHRVFGTALEDAVKDFQRDHNLRADGVVGSHTRAQVASSVRWRKANPYKGNK